jgi:hypothetical protein
MHTVHEHARANRHDVSHPREQQSRNLAPASPPPDSEDPARVLMFLPARDIRLTEVLRHLEAGKIVIIIPRPASRANPRT